MEAVRLDKWLWAARFFKTRGVASEAIKGGKVSLNGQKPKPSKMVKIADQLEITQPHRRVKIRVLALSDKRGNAQAAQKLYQLEEEWLNSTKPTAEMALAGYREKGKGRPTKRERRQLERFL